jgi:hypothetical protein
MANDGNAKRRMGQNSMSASRPRNMVAAAGVSLQREVSSALTRLRPFRLFATGRVFKPKGRPEAACRGHPGCRQKPPGGLLGSG